MPMPVNGANYVRNVRTRLPIPVNKTTKEEGQEIGADFMLQGSINTITDREGGSEVRYYQVDLELINIETHQKVWIGDKKIKKLVQRKRVSP